jgi:hypothetical protein
MARWEEPIRNKIDSHESAMAQLSTEDNRAICSASILYWVLTVPFTV